MNLPLQKIFKKYKIIFAIQYGSSLDSKNAQDYDLAVYCRNPSKVNTFKLYGELQPLLHKPLDLIILKRNSSPLLTYEIIRKGKVIYIGNQALFLSLVIFFWKRYLDTAKFRKLENLYITRTLKHVTRRY